ncbi:hypothetical protein BH23CHL2_BH23CHL2_17760 [soil metagenome]
MLHRNDDKGLLVITQPSHAWISGQLADCWGNVETGFEPAGPELRIAAEQHDIAWLEWEAYPTLNPATGLPFAFNELPTLEHLEIWRSATAHALSYGRLPALLISMHGTYLYERYHDFASDTSDEVRAARAFLAREKKFQDRTVAYLSGQRDISQLIIKKERKLVSLWDAISLALCMGIGDRREFSNVPSADEDLTLEFRRSDPVAETFTVDPWPFSGERCRLFCEGRRLDGTFEDLDDMRRTIWDSPSEFLELTLIPSR